MNVKGLGSCGKVKKFHQSCNVSWLESKSMTDAELRKVCIDCVCRQCTLEVYIINGFDFLLHMLRILMCHNHQPSLHCLKFHHHNNAL